MDEAHAFDFFVGSWDARWDGGTGRSEVRWTLREHVLEERFNGRPVGLEGLGVSVYDPAATLWRHTWVDDAGGYFAQTGGRAGERIVLTTPPLPGEQLRRTVFCNIAPDGFDWLWEGSGDGGRSWVELWRLRYDRRPA
jgi:hypothetical protein